MNKKNKSKKILKDLPGGWKIVENRKYKDVVEKGRSVRKQETSHIELYFGKKLMAGPLKNVESAMKEYEDATK
jgi:hypothetical protein